MTEQDLSTMLRSHVSDEPPFADSGADFVVGRGRRLVRRRRMAVIAGGVAVCTLAAVLVVPLLAGSPTSSNRVIDPDIADALSAYDVAAMPRTMDGHARAILGASVPELGASDFAAFDAQFQRLPEQYWDKASGLFLGYDLDETHQISVLLNHEGSSAGGDPYRTCDRLITPGRQTGYRTVISDHLFFDCEMLTASGTDTAVVSTLEADTMKPRNDSLKGWRDQFSFVTEDAFASVPADELWFTRTVEVVKSGTFVTVVTERVKAPDEETARELLRVPVDDLAAIGLDPALVMPKPPPGENGCPQWTMPTVEVSCSGND